MTKVGRPKGSKTKHHCICTKRDGKCKRRINKYHMK